MGKGGVTASDANTDVPVQQLRFGLLAFLNLIFVHLSAQNRLPGSLALPTKWSTPDGVLILQRFGPWPFSPPPAPGGQVTQSRVFLLVIAPACKVTATAGKQPDLPDEGWPSSSSLRPAHRRRESWMVAGSGNKRRKIIRDGGSPVCFQRAGNGLVFYPAHLLRICP